MKPMQQIAAIESRLPLAMLRDAAYISRRLKKIRERLGPRERPGSQGVAEGELANLERRLASSIRERERRLGSRPKPAYPENLPIVAKREEILHAVSEHQVVIISGETGSGKSTQIPKMCLEAGRGIAGRIGCTQPRRIAATTIARRIAEELGERLGGSVGYRIRFQDKAPKDAYIKVLTDGMLLAETQGDPGLYDYDTLIIDEAHERSLNIDFILGILKKLLPSRPELKIIITSATMDTEKFSRGFGNAPVVEVSGRLYDVEVRYAPLDPEMEDRGDLTYVDMAVQAADGLCKRKRSGDILIFMPTEQDILETCERLEGMNYPGTTVLPMFARLPASEQGRVYSVTGRKIVVATNVAETSLTIPGIKYVIDTGLARVSQYLPRTRTNSLPIRPVSRSSADQRKGRCGRVRNGVCIRLYSEEDYESRPAFTPPEILRSNLAEVILRMIFLRLGDPVEFPFLDPPGTRSIKDGYDILFELGAIERKGEGVVLTRRGRIMARMPLDPRISRMMLESGREGCADEVGIIAAALSIQDPRERPAEKRSQADRIHAPFSDPQSDFITLLNIWNRYHRSWEDLKTQNRMRKFCKEHFLSFPRMREWVHTREQIMTILRESRLPKGREGEPPPRSRYEAIHRSILSGYLSNVAVLQEKNIYSAAKGRRAMIFPGSCLFNKKARWIVAADMVRTSRLFARTAAKIDPAWLEELGGAFCSYTYSHPHWERKRGEVRAFEQVTLFGLPIVSKRPVSYGSINPGEAHRIFIRSALVEGDLAEPFSFLRHNLELVRRVQTMENKLRRRGILVDDDAIARFYSERLRGVHDLKRLKKLIRERGNEDFLKMKEENLVLSFPERDLLEQYPDELNVGDHNLGITYRFAPGREEDGATLHLPISMAPKFQEALTDWGIPGLFREKVTALIKGLPKSYRKQLVPVSGTVEIIMKEMERSDHLPLLSVLSLFIYRRFGVDIPASVWTSVTLPEYLRMRIAVTDHQGNELGTGRDLSDLLKLDLAGPGGRRSERWQKAGEMWERSHLTSWDFDTLPETISLGPHLIAYPALEAAEGHVNIRLFDNFEEAAESHLRGVEALLSFHLARDLKQLKRSLFLHRDFLKGAAYFGGAAGVENLLYGTLLKRHLRVNLRTREAFEACADDLRKTLFERAGELRDNASRVLDSYHRVRMAIQDLERINRSNPAAPAVLSCIREELNALVPRDFAEIYPPDRLAEIPRYLRALQVRAERGLNDPLKDGGKAERVRGFSRSLRQVQDGLSRFATPEKRDAVEEYRWMIEEFKVSLFAQELKTRFPVSEKRLEDKLREIERMT